MTMWSAFFTCFLFACVVHGFNVDTESYVRHRGAVGSMFGFSVAEHMDKSTGWVLVGAPEAQTGQPGVSRGGAVFRCAVTQDDTCQQLPFDETGNTKDRYNEMIDNKSGQWFGATVASSGPDGVILACAPRYVWYTTGREKREPVGTCYITKNSFSEYSEYSPCRTRTRHGYHRQGSCQAGLGAAVSRDGERLYVGAVGSWYWQGQLFDIATSVKQLYTRVYDTPGQVISQSVSNRMSVLQTPEGPQTEDDSYLGYSVLAGDFDGSGRPGVAVGMPRGHNLTGKVVLYTWDLKNSQNITGEQVGAYFAYALCKSDVDGDGLDDLIIGAPMYSDLNSDNKENYENGRVYIVYQGVGEKFRSWDTRDGKNSKGRFGLSLASLGDINLDGYGDFVVGAPYDGPFERGAVYIYHGSKAGVMEKASQVIYAEDVQPGMSTFGFSVAGGLDLDNNMYPDMVVGAYASDAAVFLKSRPVVRVKASLIFVKASKLISLKERNCTLRDRTPVPCITLKACFNVSGQGVARDIDMEIQYLLDVKKTKDVRLFFLSNEAQSVQNYTIRLEKDRLYCRTETVYIKSSIRDKLTPLEAELRYSLRQTSASGTGRQQSRRLTPILDQSKAASEKDSINIEKNCGPDNICIPDLKLITDPSVQKYLLGSGTKFDINVMVENNGEDAFEATFNLHLPPGMNYTKIERINAFEGDAPVQCSAPTAANNNTLKCDIGNPLKYRKVANFKVFMTPFHVAGMKSKYDFKMEVNSANQEVASSKKDNSHSMTIPIWVDTDYLISGYSYPTEIAYNISQYRSENVTSEADIGPQVAHVYYMKNQGPSDIVEAEIHFVWPSHTNDGKELLYLLEQPQTKGNIQCEQASRVNALNLVLDMKNKKTLPLELHGIRTEESSTSTTFSGTTNVGTSGYSSTSGGSKTVQGEGGPLGVGERIYAAGIRSPNTNIPVLIDSYQGGMASGNGDSAKKILVKDYRSFGTQVGGSGAKTNEGTIGGLKTHQGTNSGSRTTVEGTRTYNSSSGGMRSYGEGSSSGSRTSEGSRIYESSTTGHRTNDGDSGRGTWTHDGATGGFRTLGEGSRGGSRIYESSNSSSRTYVEGSSSGSRNNVEESTGRYRPNGEGSRTYESSSSRTYVEGGSRTRNYGEESRTNEGGDYGESGEPGIRGSSSSNDYSVGGSRVYATGSRTHQQGGGRHRGGGGGRDRTSYESRNFTSTYSENDNAPRTYSNYSFSNSSTGGGNISGSWESGQRAGHLGHVGAAHSGSHEVRTYGTARESNREVHSGGASRSGYNVGNPSSADRSNWSEERRTSGMFAPNNEGLAVYNWTSQVHNFGLDGGGGRANGDVRTRHRGEEIVRGSRPANQEPGFERNVDGSSRRTANLQRPAQHRTEDRGVKSRIKVDSDEQTGDNRLEEGDSKLHLYGRFERAASDEEKETRWGRSQDDEASNGPSANRQASDMELERVLDCAVTQCTQLKCIVKGLKKDEEVFVGFQYRVWVRTLEQVGWNRAVKLSTLMAARLTEMPHVGEPVDLKLKTTEVPMEVFSSEVSVRPDIVPLWVVVLSACAGALILLLLIFLLYKCGFFKRNRPTNSAEKEPLNRNGYHSGDEAL